MISPEELQRRFKEERAQQEALLNQQRGLISAPNKTPNDEYVTKRDFNIFLEKYEKDKQEQNLEINKLRLAIKKLKMSNEQFNIRQIEKEKQDLQQQNIELNAMVQSLQKNLEYIVLLCIRCISISFS